MFAVCFFQQAHEVVGYALMSDVVIKTAELFSQAVTATLSFRIGHLPAVGSLFVHNYLALRNPVSERAENALSCLYKSRIHQRFRKKCKKFDFACNQFAASGLLTQS
jgi:hypothetical protein